MLSRAAVAALLGVAPATISNYLYRSKPGRQYENHPFPTPDGHFAGRPYWTRGRAGEIRGWALSRPGQGAGGGYPAQRRAQG